MSVSRAPVFLQESSQTTGSGILLLSFKLSGGGHPPSAATNSQKGTSFLLWGDVGEPKTSPPTQWDALPYIRRKHPASGSDRDDYQVQENWQATGDQARSLEDKRHELNSLSRMAGRSELWAWALGAGNWNPTLSARKSWDIYMRHRVEWKNRI